ncbi:hypothetical protein EYZ11_004608 [Aspergillus tanneri]|uniref:Uncharacterized protein n=1 Tax=Aspergillus tanneri TaxID=1220188 RepID=A0A4S3JKF8_9EURO|nr:hypothetical protein EYZ11_004608 [Aspergillus tanneri]
MSSAAAVYTQMRGPALNLLDAS